MKTRNSDPIIDRIAEKIKETGGSTECLDDFETGIGRASLRRALVELQHSVQAQLTGSAASFKEATVRSMPDEEFRAIQAEHLSWRRGATRFLSTVTASLAHLKAKDRNESDAERSDPTSSDGWVVGAIVKSWKGCVGKIVSASGRRCVIEWDEFPGVPFSIIAPWAGDCLVELDSPPCS